MSEYACAQVHCYCYIIFQVLTVFGLLEDHILIESARVRVFGIGPSHELAQGAAKLIVFRPEIMSTAVPGADRIASHIVQHPALTSFHTGLVDAVAQHVVVIAHHDTVLGIYNFTLVALDVHHNGSRIKYVVTICVLTIICNR